MENGLDYSFGRPNLDQAVKAGFKFVMRYLSSAGGAKVISKTEANQIKAKKLKLGLVFEDSATNAKSGYTQGVKDATVALKQSNSIGWPVNRPIYFAVDWDTTEKDQSAIDNYLKGAASVIGAKRVGVYGSYYVVERCFKNGTAAWFWQTYAWSGGQVSSHAHLHQHLNGQTVGGAEVDLNQSKKADYGVWDFSIPKPPEEKKEMVTQRGLEVIYKFRLRIAPTDYALKHFLGKVTFDAADDAVIGSDAYKKEIERVAKTQSGLIGHLPSAIQEVVKLPEQVK